MKWHAKKASEYDTYAHMYPEKEDEYWDLAEQHSLQAEKMKEDMNTKISKEWEQDAKTIKKAKTTAEDTKKALREDKSLQKESIQKRLAQRRVRVEKRNLAKSVLETSDPKTEELRKDIENQFNKQRLDESFIGKTDPFEKSALDLSNLSNSEMQINIEGNPSSGRNTERIRQPQSLEKNVLDLSHLNINQQHLSDIGSRAKSSDQPQGGVPISENSGYDSNEIDQSSISDRSDQKKDVSEYIKEVKQRLIDFPHKIEGLEHNAVELENSIEQQKSRLNVIQQERREVSNSFDQNDLDIQLREQELEEQKQGVLEYTQNEQKIAIEDEYKLEIKKINDQIREKRRGIEGNIDYEKVRDIEDEIKSLEQQIKKLEKDKSSALLKASELKEDEIGEVSNINQNILENRSSDDPLEKRLQEKFSDIDVQSKAKLDEIKTQSHNLNAYDATTEFRKDHKELINRLDGEVKNKEKRLSSAEKKLEVVNVALESANREYNDFRKAIQVLDNIATDPEISDVKEKFNKGLKDFSIDKNDLKLLQNLENSIESKELEKINIAERFNEQWSDALLEYNELKAFSERQEETISVLEKNKEISEERMQSLRDEIEVFEEKEVAPASSSLEAELQNISDKDSSQEDWSQKEQEPKETQEALEKQNVLHKNQIGELTEEKGVLEKQNQNLEREVSNQKVLAEGEKEQAVKLREEKEGISEQLLQKDKRIESLENDLFYQTGKHSEQINNLDTQLEKQKKVFEDKLSKSEQSLIDAQKDQKALLNVNLENEEKLGNQKEEIDSYKKREKKYQSGIEKLEEKNKTQQSIYEQSLAEMGKKVDGKLSELEKDIIKKDKANTKELSERGMNLKDALEKVKQLEEEKKQQSHIIAIQKKSLGFKNDQIDVMRNDHKDQLSQKNHTISGQETAFKEELDANSKLHENKLRGQTEKHKGELEFQQQQQSVLAQEFKKEKTGLLQGLEDADNIVTKQLKENASLKEQNQQLTNNVAEALGTSKEVEQKNGKLSGQISEKDALLATAQKENQGLSGQINTLENTIENNEKAASNEKEKLHSQNVALESQLNDQKSTLLQKDALLATASKKNQESDNQIKNLYSQLEEQKSANTGQKTEFNKKLSTQKEEHDKALKENQQKLFESEKQNQQLTNSLSEKSSMFKEVDEKYKILSKETEQQKTQIENLNSVLERNKEEQVNIAATHQSSLADKDKEIEKVRTEYEKQLSEKDQLLGAARKENQRLSDQIESLSGTIENNEKTAHKEKGKLYQQNATLESELNDQKKKVERYESLEVTSNEKLESLNQTTKDQKNQLSQKDKLIDDGKEEKQKLSESEKQAQNLSKQVRSLEGKVKYYKNDLSSIDEKPLEELQANYEEELEKRDAKINTLENTIESQKKESKEEIGLKQKEIDYQKKKEC